MSGMQKGDGVDASAGLCPGDIRFSLAVGQLDLQDATNQSRMTFGPLRIRAFSGAGTDSGCGVEHAGCDVFQKQKCCCPVFRLSLVQRRLMHQCPTPCDRSCDPERKVERMHSLRGDNAAAIAQR